MKTTALTRDEVEKAQKEIQVILDAWAASKGWSCDYKTVRVGDQLFEPSIRINTISRDAADRSAYMRGILFLSDLNLKASDFHRKFNLGEREFVLVGVNPWDRKNPVTASSEGKRYELKEEAIKYIIASR